MKICWDNLEKLKYRPDRGEWQNKKYKANFYIYKESCKNCGEPFLAQTGISLFCNYSCAKINKKLSDTVKEKLKNPKNCPNYKGGLIDKNIPLYNTYAHQISFCEKVRRNEEDQNILEVKCAYCGKWFIPKRVDIRNRIQSLNNERDGESRFYCSTQCKQECPIYKKIKYQVGHPKVNYKEYSREVQPELRQMCLERDNYTCQICGKNQDELDVGLHCHHIEGIWQNPIESADLDMVITLCKNCHKKVHTLPGCGYNDMKCKEN